MSDTTHVSALDQLLLDLFNCALEGGINYWSQCAAYHWQNRDHSEDHKGFYAIILETEEDDKQHRVTRATMSKGYRLATTTWRDKLHWSTGKPPLVVGPETDWDYDAGDADMILQLGLFEDVVYG
jgi:hypothetical protein